MVEKCINLDAFSTYANTVRKIYFPSENPTYIKRNGDIDHKNFEKYIENFKDVCSSAHSDVTRILLNEHNSDVNDACSYSMGVNDRYTCDNGIYCDSKNVLECLGVVTYARKYQIVYDVIEELPVILSYLTGDRWEDLEAKLKAKLEEMQIPYDLFSRAILGNSSTLDQFIQFDAFIDLTPAMTQILNDMYGRSKTLMVNIHNNRVFPWDMFHSRKRVVKYVWHSMILEMQEFLLTCIMQCYDTWRNDQCMLTSKGRTNVVIQSKVENIANDVLLRSNGVDVKYLKPKIYSDFGYVDSLIKD